MLNSLLVAMAALAVSDPEGIVTTAPVGSTGAVLVGAEAPVAPEVPAVSGQEITPHGLSTAEQIDRWIAQRSEASEAYGEDGEGSWLERDDRKVHGEVSAAIGTGDFSAYSASVSLPIGETGRLNLSYSQSKNDYGYGYGGPYGYGYGYGPGGFGPGGFGSTGRGFGLGYGAPVFAPGVVYPGRPLGSPPLTRTEQPSSRRDGDADRAPLIVAD
ncbi:hypothetical protein [Brevundimonas variabilis]|uniref:Uncharacterized protein n=1 Tax=Brevundimonas variabilis TaxID=74312 RepID=A0A7W9FDK1_9CAUL|nr:hypothetical protein [Brevundimonas variabilis]MBB5745347.1 hypothetical protein [Brevundimonas variabilis]